MQTTDHNKVLGVIHIAYGAFSVLMVVVMMFFMAGILGLLAADTREPAPLVFVVVVMLFALGINIVLSLPSFVAGYAMLKRKSWARAAAIVASIVDALSFPFGTALCVYTLWFMFSPEGKLLYDHQAKVLPPPPPNWESATSPKQEFQYAPPDWR